MERSAVARQGIFSIGSLERAQQVKIQLRYYGDPILREKTHPVTEITGELRVLVENMVETMREEKGVGLAAPQIGRSEALCVIEIPPDFDVDEDGKQTNPICEMPMIFFNPKITKYSTVQWSMEEGCLSFPGISGPIQRSRNISVSYMDSNGNQVECELNGYTARVVQHEVDHLHGVLFIDRMSPVRKAAVSGRLKRLSKETLSDMGIV